MLAVRSIWYSRSESVCVGAGVNADRIDVLHVANDDAVVRAIAQHFVLDFFPAEKTRFHERLVT
jgi:hypothetical protein